MDHGDSGSGQALERADRAARAGATPLAPEGATTDANAGGATGAEAEAGPDADDTPGAEVSGPAEGARPADDDAVLAAAAGAISLRPKSGSPWRKQARTQCGEGIS